MVCPGKPDDGHAAFGRQAVKNGEWNMRPGMDKPNGKRLPGARRKEAIPGRGVSEDGLALLGADKARVRVFMYWKRRYRTAGIVLE